MTTIAQPNKNKLTVRLDKDLWERLRIFAIKSGTSAQSVTSDAISSYLDSQKKGDARHART